MGQRPAQPQTTALQGIGVEAGAAGEVIELVHVDGGDVIKTRQRQALVAGVEQVLPLQVQRLALAAAAFIGGVGTHALRAAHEELFRTVQVFAGQLRLPGGHHRLFGVDALHPRGHGPQFGIQTCGSGGQSVHALVG